MKYAGALGVIFAVIFGLIGISQLEGLQTSLSGSISGPLADLVTNLGFILLLVVVTVLIGGVLAAFKAMLR